MGRTKKNDKMDLLTNAARGCAYGDVSNKAVRNILSEISKSIFGGCTEQEIHDTLKYFDWKCPYTGRDLRQSIKNKDKSYEMDHIYPQNQEWCGLNVKGNLVFVDKRANSKKGGKSIEEFLRTDEEILGDLDMETREARLEKIKEFQDLCGYNPKEICEIVSPMLKARYDEVRAEQEKYISDALQALESIGLYALKKNDLPVDLMKTKNSKFVPEIVFNPGDENQFKNELIKTKRAHFVLTYESGKKVLTKWKAESFDLNSSLRMNIQSRPFWRNKKKEGLLRVEVFVDYE